MFVGFALWLGIAFTGCHRAANPSGDIKISGNIEVVDAQLSFKIPGRIAERAVSEGDHVKSGQLIARLDDMDQREQLAVRKAELAAAQAALAELEAGSRPQEIASAEAAVRSAEAERRQAQLDYERAQELVKQAAIAQRDFDVSDAQRKVADAHVADAQERLKLVREGPRAETIQQARARVQQAEAALAVAQTQLEYTQLSSPMDGVVLSHSVEKGEYVSPGTPVVTVGDNVHLWVRGYVEEADLGRIRHGEHVAVTTDSLPGKTYDGVIGFISSEAEFTPKTVQTSKERVKLVFRIKVYVDNPNDELKPGMPADVVIKPVNR
jgi:HlyD family secretion protein